VQKKLEMKPERTDTYFLKEVLQMAFNARFGMIILTVVVMALLALLYYLVSRPAYTVVIDRTTGQTYAPVGLAKGVTQDLLDRQLVYYSAQMIEAYANFDHNTIREARRRVYELSNSKFREALGGEGYMDDEEVKQCIANKAEFSLQWEMHPRITQRNDPYYTLFATFQRVVRWDGLTREVKKFNVRVDWGRLNENMDYTKRPHSLVLLGIKYLNESNEVNEQINRLK